MTKKRPAARRAAKRAASGRSRPATGPSEESSPPAPVLIATPQRSIPLHTPENDRVEQIVQRIAMQWTYVVRNRRRWAGREPLVEEQARRAEAVLRETFGLTQTDLKDLANARVAQVVIPYEREEDDWAARVFPWEFVITAATQAYRWGEPLTILRQLQ